MIFRSMDLDGRWFGRRRPSSEWRFHRDILKARDEVAAIVHTHSPKATASPAPAEEFLPFITWSRLRVAPTSAVRRITRSARRSSPTPRSPPWRIARRVCSPITASSRWARTCRAALALAGEVENLAAQYCTALAIGEVRILDEIEMRRVVEKFRTYGKQDAADSGLVFGGGDLPSARSSKEVDHGD